jgi:hypothetical protein
MIQEKNLSIRDFRLRSSMAQFRLSAHKLEIEKGRFINNNYISPNERICKQCNLAVCEDEEHFLLNCPLYSSLRSSLYDTCSANNPFFNMYNNDQKFLWLLTNEDMNSILKVAEYIYEGMKMRKDM